MRDEPARSLWLATAAVEPEFDTLSGDISSNVAVIGGGFTGLSAALHLAEGGADVVLLEAETIGHGASGRNGGQVIPGLKHDPEALEAKLGPEQGRRLSAFGGGTADFLFDLVERHAIACDAVRTGWIQGAPSKAGVAAAWKRAAEWQARGAAVDPLDADGVAALVGTRFYRGGLIDRRGGHVQPLSLARGLAGVASRAGARLFVRSPVTGTERMAGAWIVTTPVGRVRCERLVVCTAAYTGELWSALSRSVVCANSLQVATEPLDPETRAGILPGNQSVSETRNLLYYYRFDRTHRLVLGGYGLHTDPRGDADFAHVADALSTLFPQLAGVPLPFRWFGRFASTADHLPHLHELGPGAVGWIGCNGRGVALSVAMGGQLASHTLGTPPADLAVPVSPVRQIPFPGLRRWYVAGATRWYGALDAVAR